MDLSFYTAWARGGPRGWEYGVSDERLLCTQEREVKKAGGLPGSRPERMWGGPGGGAPCALCGRDIGTEEMEFELQYSSKEEGSESYHVHVRCFTGWDVKHRSREAKERPLPGRSTGGIMEGGERNRINRGREPV